MADDIHNQQMLIQSRPPSQTATQQQQQQQSQQQSVATAMSIGNNIDQTTQMNVTTSVPINVAAINVSQTPQLTNVQTSVNNQCSENTVQIAVPQLTPQAQTHTAPAGSISQGSGPPPPLIHPAMTVAQSPLQQVQVIQQPLSASYVQHVYTPHQQVLFPGNVTLQHAGMAAPTLQSLGPTQSLSLQLQPKATLDPKTSIGGHTIQAVNAANKGLAVNSGAMMSASGIIGASGQKNSFHQQMVTSAGKSAIIHSQPGFAPSSANQTVVIGHLGVLPSHQSVFNNKAISDSQKGKTFMINQPTALQPKSPIYSSTLPLHSSQAYNGNHLKQLVTQPQLITSQTPGTMFSQAQILGSLQPLGGTLPQGISWATPGGLQSSALLTQSPIIIRSHQSDMFIQSHSHSTVHLPVASAPVPPTSFAATPQAPLKSKQVRIKPKLRVPYNISPNPGVSSSVPQMATTQTQTNQSNSQCVPLLNQKSDAANQTAEIKGVSNQSKSAMNEAKHIQVSRSPGKCQALVTPTKFTPTTVTISPVISCTIPSTVHTPFSNVPIVTMPLYHSNSSIESVEAKNGMECTLIQGAKLNCIKNSDCVAENQQTEHTAQQGATFGCAKNSNYISENQQLEHTAVQETMLDHTKISSCISNQQMECKAQEEKTCYTKNSHLIPETHHMKSGEGREEKSVCIKNSGCMPENQQTACVAIPESKSGIPENQHVESTTTTTTVQVAKLDCMSENQWKECTAVQETKSDYMKNSACMTEKQHMSCPVTRETKSGYTRNSGCMPENRHIEVQDAKLGYMKNSSCMTENQHMKHTAIQDTKSGCLIEKQQMRCAVVALADSKTECVNNSVSLPEKGQIKYFAAQSTKLGNTKNLSCMAESQQLECTIAQEAECADEDKSIQSNKSPLPPVKDKQPQKAIVKPQILTHVIDGYIIQEGSEPFPVSRSSLYTDAISSKTNPLKSSEKQQELSIGEQFSPSKSIKRKIGLKRKSWRKQEGGRLAYNPDEYSDNGNDVEMEEGDGFAHPGKTEDRTASPSGSESSLSSAQSLSLQKDGEMQTDKVNVELTAVLPQKWSVQEVFEFIHDIPGCSEYADVFRSQEIDGQALLLLKVDHLITSMHMKLGPALKLIARINSIKAELSHS